MITGKSPSEHRVVIVDKSQKEVTEVFVEYLAKTTVIQPDSSLRGRLSGPIESELGIFDRLRGFGWFELTTVKMEEDSEPDSVSVLVKSDDLPKANRLVNQLMDKAQREQTVDDTDES